MERNDPSHPHHEAADGEQLDALRRLEARLERASGAAERLIAEAAARATGHLGPERGPDRGGGAGPRGESRPGGDAGRGGGAGPGLGPAGRPPAAGWQASDAPEPADPELMLRVLHALRDLIPAELQRRLAEALRELLLALRALIDWYLERAERRHAAPAVVQDIPIL